MPRALNPLCMLCGSTITRRDDGIWCLTVQLETADPWWIDHCTGHDLRGVEKADPDLRHVPRPNLADLDELEAWLT